MIVGLGCDLVDIRRIRKMLECYGQRFVDRIYTQYEKERSEKKLDPASSYACRFAAKEACSKALGTGLSSRVSWQDMSVTNLDTGKPTLILTGGAAHRLENILPSGSKPSIHLTLTDSFPMAQAFVVIEALPKDPEC